MIVLLLVIIMHLLIFKNVPKVVWIRGDLMLILRNIMLLNRNMRCKKNVFNEFDSIVVISETVRSSLFNLFNISENVITISNSVDVEKITQLSKEFVPGFDKPTFVTLGRLDNNKNQILLLKACKLLKNKVNDFNVYLLGDGEDRKFLQKYIDEGVIEAEITPQKISDKLSEINETIARKEGRLKELKALKKAGQTIKKSQYTIPLKDTGDMFNAISYEVTNSRNIK